MLTLGQQKVDFLTLVVLTLLTVAAVVLAFAAPQTMPWSLLLLAGASVIIFWAVKLEITLWAWFWVLSFGLLDWPQWRFHIPGFFVMSGPRIVFLVAVLAFLLHFLIRTWRVRFDRKLLWAVLIMLAYFALSATVAGWKAGGPVPSAPYFRFLGSMLFPFVVFFLVYNSTHSPRQIKRVLICLSIFAWFALYIGYLQYAYISGWEEARDYIWPTYINSKSYGIHFDRARGPFPCSNWQASLLVAVFYGNLFLIRRIRGPYRAALVIQAVLIPPAIFFTGLRSGYLAFLLCGVVWCIWGNRLRLGKIKLALIVAGLILAVTVLWQSLTQEARARGGVTQMGPIRSREILLLRAWSHIKEHPVLGVGWGHYIRADYEIKRDPGSYEASPGAVATVQTPGNLFVVVLTETGVVGLAMLVAVFVLLFRQSLKLYRKLPPTAEGMLCPEFVALFWVMLVNYLADASFVDPLWEPFGNGLMWAMAGLVVGYNRLLEPKPVELPVASLPPSS